MELGTTAVDNAMHLAIFVVGAVVAGLTAIFVIERLGARDQTVITSRHVILAFATFGGLWIAERMYHAFA